MYGFEYNGLGDRLSQTVNEMTTNYTLDLNSGLTQVLNDGNYDYLYGVSRIAQATPYLTEYYLTDALGSIRQVASSAGEVTLSKRYDPYGWVLDYEGSSNPSFGYAGEMQDSTGMVYLRARYYEPTDGRFVSRDTWGGDYNKPMSYNAWLYTYANPIRYIDPSGRDADCSLWDTACQAELSKENSTPYKSQTMLIGTYGAYLHPSIPSSYAVQAEENYNYQRQDKYAIPKNDGMDKASRAAGAIGIGVDICNGVLLDYYNNHKNDRDILFYLNIDFYGDERIGVKSLRVDNRTYLELKVIRFVFIVEAKDFIQGSDSTVHRSGNDRYGVSRGAQIGPPDKKIGLAPAIQKNSVTTISLTPSGYSSNPNNLFYRKDKVDISLLFSRNVKNAQLYPELNYTINPGN